MPTQENEQRHCPEHGMVDIEKLQVGGTEVIVYSCFEEHQQSFSSRKDRLPRGGGRREH